jgi:chitinase
MVSISCNPTSVWTNGFNASFIIKNDSNINYGSNWNISCSSSGFSITWCDFMKITPSGDKIILTPQNYVNPLNANSILNGNFGGTGIIPKIFTFNSGSVVPVLPITPVPITPVTPVNPVVPITPVKPVVPITPVNPVVPVSPVIPIPISGVNKQRRVVYLGYWLSDSDVPRIVSDLKNANVTHALLTFITHPDNKKSLTTSASMIESFKSLTTENQKLLTTSSFKLGVSICGALQVQVPYSLTFCNPDCYYYNNPQKYAQDIFNLVKGTGLENFFDLDIEHINDKFSETATFLGEVCKELKRLNPRCEISHAPQPPYFWSSFGNVYDLIYKNYKQYFDFFNIQYYNNNLCNNFKEIFIKSYENVAPQTSILELINRGLEPSYLVVGKTIENESNSDNGYIPLQEMSNIVKTAFNTPSLSGWCKTGGLMIWYYNTQNQSENNKQLLNYFKTSQF